jgi:undecaprenyl-diphosphatase
MGWELKWMEWTKGWWTSPFLDQVLPWLTHLGSHFAVVFFIILVWILTKEKKVLGCVSLLYAMQSGIVYSLKYLIHRPRPLFLLGLAEKLSPGPGEILDPSFPSAHTTYAFMMATLLANWFPPYRVTFFTMAGFIGWTRLYLGLHYPTDVIAAGLLGYGITKILLHYCTFPIPPK